MTPLLIETFTFLEDFLRIHILPRTPRPFLELCDKLRSTTPHAFFDTATRPIETTFVNSSSTHIHDVIGRNDRLEWRVLPKGIRWSALESVEAKRIDSAGIQRPKISAALADTLRVTAMLTCLSH